ncbi:MAG: flagellar filament capping protein FliD [bacterium]|nr:flagellar filament capping protein FliD [bacterium]
MNATNSISGLISGLDTAALVDSLIQYDRRPAYVLEARKAREELRLAAYDALEAAMANLKNSLTGLRRPSDFRTMRATVTGPTIMNATAGQNASPGTYNLSVEQLAQSHQVVSLGYSSEDVVLGTGTVTLSLAGTEEVSVELSDGANTLRDLTDAINAAGSDITATLVNTGSDSNPWQLILSGAETGEDQIITIDSTLTGGSGLALGTVGPVVIGAQTGTSTVTSGGHYTGNSDANYSFTVATGGVLGADDIIIDWTNDQGQSGQVVLDSSYTGEPVEVFGSMTLAFGAGDLVSGDNWTVGSVASTIQTAQDSIVKFGTSDPITVSNSQNTLTELVTGVTINLLSADPGTNVTIKVEQDTSAVTGKIENFVNEYNNLIQFFNDQFSYDPDSENAGLLLGDRSAMTVDNDIRYALMKSMQNLGTEFSSLSQIGIGTSVTDTLNTDGKLAIDSETLTAALRDDLDGVISLLGSTGSALDNDINFLNAGSHTSANSGVNGYGVHVTTAASHGSYAGGSFAEPSMGSPLTLGPTNDNLKLNIDSVESDTIAVANGNYTSGTQLAQAIQDAIDADEELSNVHVIVSWVDDGGGNGHIEMTSKSYGESSKVEVMNIGSSIYGDIGLDSGASTDGVDVEGFFMVNGEVEEASGSGRILTGNQENGATDSLSVEVTITAAELASQGEDQGTVSIWSGITDSLYKTMDNFLDEVTGTIELRQTAMRDTIDDFDDQIKAIDSRLEIRRKRYTAEFQRMEQLISEMQSNSNSFNSMLASLPTISSSSSSSSG